MAQNIRYFTKAEEKLFSSCKKKGVKRCPSNFRKQWKVLSQFKEKHRNSEYTGTKIKTSSKDGR